MSLAAVALSLLLLEVGLRSYHAAKSYFAKDTGGQTPRHTNQTPPVPLHVVTDAPYLYGLNPNHPDISPQGTRDDEAPVPKPAGTFRVLVLGDSLAYASSIPRGKTFPDRLEALLRERFGAVDVVNAGVSGYTAYNELQYYLAKGREFEADLVVVAFCMNDVVNPRLHWGDAPNVKFPDDAIPNRDYDRDHILPRIREQQERQRRPAPPTEAGPPVLKHSALYRALEPGLKRLFGGDGGDTFHKGPGPPTYLTGEDDISIKVLLDESSPEWRWLAGIYDRLHEATRTDGAALMIAVFPLAYQMDEGYPFFPQRQIADYCARNSIPCLDLLPSFKRRTKQDVFLLNNSGYYDVWHLTEAGHEMTATEMARFMFERGLLPPHAATRESKR